MTLKRQVKQVLRALGLGPPGKRVMAAWRERQIQTAWTITGGCVHREYQSEAQYLAHQKSKLGIVDPLWLADQDSRLRIGLYERLTVARGSRVLCLGARTGAEVQAFLDRGCFAVGVDLNPGLENRYVVAGDFHHLQFPDGCVDVVYTNSLDHVRDLTLVVGEVTRVLTPSGLFLVEASKGTEGGWKAEYWESFAWPRLSALVEALEAAGLRLVAQQPFTEPWAGEQLTLATHRPDPARSQRPVPFRSTASG